MDNTYEDELNDIIAQHERNMTIFKKSYALAKLYPNDPNYTTDYVESKKRLTDLSQSLIDLNYRILTSINKVNDTSIDANNNINISKNTSETLDNELTNIVGQINSAKQMSQDFKKIYTEQYIANIAMLMGVVFSSTALVYVFGKMPSSG